MENRANFLKSLRKSFFISSFFKETLNLDIDFSKSKKVIRKHTEIEILG